MVRREKKDDLFLWPPEPDVQTVPKKDILFVLTSPPAPIDRCHFTVKDFRRKDALIED